MLELISLELLSEVKSGRCECGGSMIVTGAYMVCDNCGSYAPAFERNN